MKEKEYHVEGYERFERDLPYFMRHFKGVRGFLARVLLGRKRIWNLLYDSHNCGWGVGFDRAQRDAKKKQKEL